MPNHLHFKTAAVLFLSFCLSAANGETLTQLDVKITASHLNWIQTISICNTTTQSIPLSDLEITFNYAATMPFNIWGTPWVQWQLNNQTGTAVVLKGGSPYAPPLPPDPYCVSPLLIQFNAAPEFPLPTEPFVFSADIGEAAVTTGSLTLNMPEAPKDGLSAPQINIQGPDSSREQILEWGKTLNLSSLKPGNYTISAARVDNGSSFYVAPVFTVVVEAGKNTVQAITYSAVPTGKVLVSFTGAPQTQETLNFAGEIYQFTKTLTNNESILLPNDVYSVTGIETGYTVTITPNPLTVPANTSLSVDYVKQSTACNYDVSQDKLTFVQEYKTKAITGWYTDNFATPVTTVDDTIYYVYVKPNATVRVGTIKNGNIAEYNLDDSFTVRADGHNEFSIGVDRDGYVHVMGNMHNTSLQYWRSDTPFNVTKFSRHFGDIEGDNFTYGYFRKDRNNDLYIVARARALKNYNSIGGRGAGVYRYDRSTKHWKALGAVPNYPDAVFKMVAWEDSSEGGKNYQMYKPDMRFDKNNVLHFTTALNNENAANRLNYVVYGLSNDGITFKTATGRTISPMPMRVDAGSSQGDVPAGYHTAEVGEHSGIWLNSAGNPGVYYSIDNATWYRYFSDGQWSAPIKLLTWACQRCFTLSDQDNGVMTLVSTAGKWYRFTKFGQTPIERTVPAAIYRWDLSALEQAHVYRGVSWNSGTGDWIIYRIDVQNPTKCY